MVVKMAMMVSVTVIIMGLKIIIMVVHICGTYRWLGNHDGKDNIGLVTVVVMLEL